MKLPDVRVASANTALNRVIRRAARNNSNKG